MQDHSEWGPSLNDYSDTFERRIQQSFAEYAKRQDILVSTGAKWVPLSTLETVLAISEHMYQLGFQAGGQIYTQIIASLREYSKIQGGDILKHYYGFICVRHLVHMISLGTVENSKKANAFLTKTPPSTPWTKASEQLSEAALELMFRAVAAEDMVTLFSIMGFVPVNPLVAFKGACDNGLTEEDAWFWIDVLWKSRKSIIFLRSKGLLHGLPVLLFVFYHITQYTNDVPTFQRPWLKIQDLVLRCYLSTTKDSDRQYLRQISQWIQDLANGPKSPLTLDYQPVDDDDAREVVRAYNTLLSPPIPLSLAPVMLLDISITMFRWVYYMLTNPQPRRPALDELVPSATKAAFERLWLEIDRECDGLMVGARRGYTRMYAMDLIWLLSIYHKKSNNLPSQDELLKILFNLEIYSLIGRILMFVTWETEPAPKHWHDFVDGADYLAQALGTLSKISDAQAELAISEWYKVNDQLVYHRGYHPLSKTPENLLKSAKDKWLVF